MKTVTTLKYYFGGFLATSLFLIAVLYTSFAKRMYKAKAFLKNLTALQWLLLTMALLCFVTIGAGFYLLVANVINGNLYHIS